MRLQTLGINIISLGKSCSSECTVKVDERGSVAYISVVETSSPDLTVSTHSEPPASQSISCERLKSTIHMGCRREVLSNDLIATRENRSMGSRSQARCSHVAPSWDAIFFSHQCRISRTNASCKFVERNFLSHPALHVDVQATYTLMMAGPNRGFITRHTGIMACHGTPSLPVWTVLSADVYTLQIR